FDLKGTLNKADTTSLRAGLSANASIILAKVETALAVKEAVVQYEPNTQQPSADIQTGDPQCRTHEIELGISDGIYVEVLKGLDSNDKVRVWNQIKPAQAMEAR